MRRGGEAVAAWARQGDMPKKSVCGMEHEAKEANMFGKERLCEWRGQGRAWVVGAGRVQCGQRGDSSDPDATCGFGHPPGTHHGVAKVTGGGGTMSTREKKMPLHKPKSEGVRSHAWQGPPGTATPPLTANHVRSCQHAWSPAFPSPTHRPPTPGGARVSEVPVGVQRDCPEGRNPLKASCGRGGRAGGGGGGAGRDRCGRRCAQMCERK
jgi:hypothetical protein